MDLSCSNCILYVNDVTLVLGLLSQDVFSLCISDAK